MGCLSVGMKVCLINIQSSRGFCLYRLLEIVPVLYYCSLLFCYVTSNLWMFLLSLD